MIDEKQLIKANYFYMLKLGPRAGLSYEVHMVRAPLLEHGATTERINGSGVTTTSRSLLNARFRGVS